MGSGKSTIGAALATRLVVPFVDLDAALEASSGRTIQAWFETLGEPSFRVAERAELATTLDRLAREGDGRGDCSRWGRLCRARDPGAPRGARADRLARRPAGGDPRAHRRGRGPAAVPRSGGRGAALRCAPGRIRSGRYADRCDGVRPARSSSASSQNGPRGSARRLAAPDVRPYTAAVRRLFDPAERRRPSLIEVSPKQSRRRPACGSPTR